MVLLHSNATNIGAFCPDFDLISVDDKRYSLSDFSSAKSLLVAFICNHCPYVRAIEDRLISLGRAFDKKDFQIVAICSNDKKAYPDDAKENLRKRAHERNYGFVYLVDEDQGVAKAFDAVCTPDFFLYDQERKLFYHGQLDDNWQDASKVQHEILKDAIKAILAHEQPPREQKPSMGCSIKWKTLG
jgi:peroxiredoxin